jgi:hypothetical protein
MSVSAAELESVFGQNFSESKSRYDINYLYVCT